MLGLPLGLGLAPLAEAARRLELDFPVLLDRYGDTFGAWGGYVLPTSYLLDRSGRARYVALGPLEWDGQEVRFMLEEDALFSGGELDFIDGRQTEFWLI